MGSGLSPNAGRPLTLSPLQAVAHQTELVGATNITQVYGSDVARRFIYGDGSSTTFQVNRFSLTVRSVVQLL